MIADSLQRRDREILRTIGRLRYVTTQEIVTTFFPSPSIGRRRLRHLSGLDLIATHRKGVPDALPYYAWRLTSRGLELVADSFPDEPIPDGLAERLPDGSLHNLDHRAALSRLYLGLLRGAGGSMPPDADLATVHAVVDAQRARGTQLFWQPDGDVILRFDRAGEETLIVPDATVCGRHRAVRVFVELDRSTRGLARIGENLDRYAWLLRHRYADLFPDGRSACLLYVVRSAGRQAGIHGLATRRLGDDLRWAVLLEKEAIRHLEERVVDAAHDASTTDTGVDEGSAGRLHAAARSVYTWAKSYERQLRAEGRTLPPEGQAVLVELYQELRSRRRRREAAPATEGAAP